MSWHKLSFTPVLVQEVSIDLPSSKSIANRLLILQYLSKESCNIEQLSDANDTQILHSILQGKKIPQQINCQDAGTVLRFMTCLCATQNGQEFILSGTSKLMSRPMQPLLDCLLQLGAEIYQEQRNNQKVLRIKGKTLQSTPLKIAGNISSQFITALCLIASEIEGGLQLQIEEPIYSKPYINITLQLLNHVGIKSTFSNNRIRIKQQAVQRFDMMVEADWSSACFFYAFMLLSDTVNNLRINRLQLSDIQGDKYIHQICSKLGIETKEGPSFIDLRKTSATQVPDTIHLADYPDLAIPLLVACAFRYPDMKFTGLDHLQFKESNRIQALQSNLENFGIQLQAKNDTICIKKSNHFAPNSPYSLHTFDDHRIAMSCTLLAALGYKIELDSLSCVAKSFPDFYAQMRKLGFRIENSII